jgi:DNA-directed RNA polymerase subunit RPC12/RpoP
MRKVVMLGLVVAITGAAAAYFGVFSREQAAAAAGGVWKCPPCGGECHDRDYDRAGHCSGCGMRLITKAKYDDAVAAQAAARGTGR